MDDSVLQLLECVCYFAIDLATFEDWRDTLGTSMLLESIVLLFLAVENFIHESEAFVADVHLPVPAHSFLL